MLRVRTPGAALLGLALLAAPLPAAPGGEICYVDRVVARGGGVAISFTYAHQAEVRAGSGGAGRTVRIGPRRRPLLLRPGESATISNTHDGCILSVAADAGRRGLLARAWSWDADAELNQVERFFPAERRR